MVSTGGGDIGAAKLTGEVIKPGLKNRELVKVKNEQKHLLFIKIGSRCGCAPSGSG